MRKLIVFNHLSLDAYFVDQSGSMNWAKADSHDEEWDAFVAENSRGNGPLLFGRVTYDLMTSYWPTSMASQHQPVIAERMNKLPKIVFSRTLTEATWSNTTLLKGDLTTEVRRLKSEPGEGITVLGSGTLVSQLAQANLVDEYHLLFNPVILGAGRTLFEKVQNPPHLKLAKTRPFKNGTVLVCYESAA